VKLLSTAEVAARLGISRQRVGALQKEGRLKGTKVGHYWSFRESEVERLVRLPAHRPPKPPPAQK
jgi:excisionase family DNA binding protein